MKSVHWPLMGGMLHSVQQGGDWAGPVPIALWFNVPAKALNNVKHFSKITTRISAVDVAYKCTRTHSIL